jgi:hypothetical protein
LNAINVAGSVGVFGKAPRALEGFSSHYQLVASLLTSSSRRLIFVRISCAARELIHFLWTIIAGTFYRNSL